MKTLTSFIEYVSPSSLALSALFIFLFTCRVPSVRGNIISPQLPVLQSFKERLILYYLLLSPLSNSASLHAVFLSSSFVQYIRSLLNPATLFFFILCTRNPISLFFMTLSCRYYCLYNLLTIRIIYSQGSTINSIVSFGI